MFQHTQRQKQLKEKIGDSKREFMMREIGGTEAQFFAEENPTVEEIIESMPFKPAPRVTEADEKNDRRSLERKLPNSLYLIVKRNRTNNSWQFPQGKVLDNENSMRSVAERVLDRAGGKFRRVGGSTIAVPQYIMPYESQGGVGTNPNNQIQQNAMISTQGAENSSMDKNATKIGGSRKRKIKRGGNSDWNWGCYSGGRTRSRKSRKSKKRRKNKTKKSRKNRK
jgi:hypothetical protein